MIQKTIVAKDYSFHLEDVSEEILSGQFYLDRTHSNTQFNVFEGYHRIAYIKSSESPFWVRHKNKMIPAPSGWMLSLPPNSIVEWEIPAGRSIIETFALKKRLPLERTSFPYMWEQKEFFTPTTHQEFFHFFNPPKNAIFVGRQTTPSDMAIAIKSWVDHNYNSELRISDLALQWGTSRERVSRLFCQTFGLSLRSYRKQLKLDASISDLLFKRQKITYAALNAGYDSLGSYYKQFRSNFGSTPRSFEFEKVPVDQL